LRNLNDHELRHLDYLIKRANGLVAWKPPKRNNRRMLYLAEICDLLDKAERRKPPNKLAYTKLSDDERQNLRNLLSMSGVWAELFEHHYRRAG